MTEPFEGNQTPLTGTFVTTPSNRQRQVCDIIDSFQLTGESWIKENELMFQKQNLPAGDKTTMLNEFLATLREELLQTEDLPVHEIVDFVNKLIFNFKCRAELYDDIVKIRMLPHYPKITKRTYSKKASLILKTWLLDNFDHPYPQKAQITQLIDQTGLKEKQILNWFINSRNKYKNRNDRGKTFKQILEDRVHQMHLNKRKKVKEN